MERIQGGDEDSVIDGGKGKSAWPRYVDGPAGFEEVSGEVDCLDPIALEVHDI